MTLTPEKVKFLWETVSKFRTLFSDLTRGDHQNFVNYLTASGTIWLEVLKQNEIVGIVTCEGLERITDIEAHVMFFDHKLVPDKVPICKAVLRWLFATFPIQRVTVTVPVIYYATVRLVRELKFREEGRKRQAVLIGSRWNDVYIFGITRREAL